MNIRTLKDIPELEGKKVLVRVDFNVPLKDNGEVQDASRIEAAIPTIRYLKDHNAKIILISHLGRPTPGALENNLKLDNVAKKLSEILQQPVKKTDTVLGEDAMQAISDMQEGDIVMLENIRSRKEEEECDPNFSKQLAQLGEIFISDAFGAAHRKHASTYGLSEHLPSYAGFLIEKEVNALTPLIKEEPEHPLTMIFGGAKIDTKIGVIKNFIQKADHFLIGGGIANTFLYAKGLNVGSSLYEADKKTTADEILQEAGNKLVLPTDAVIAEEVSESANSETVNIEDVPENSKILDLGPETTEKFIEIIKNSKTIIWNGPVGLYEFPQFAKSSEAIAKAIAEHDCTSIIGGGDTADAIKRFNIPHEKFTHISTGGGAAIEFLEGKSLPGIECLREN